MSEALDPKGRMVLNVFESRNKNDLPTALIFRPESRDYGAIMEGNDFLANIAQEVKGLVEPKKDPEITFENALALAETAAAKEAGDIPRVAAQAEKLQGMR